MRSGPAGGPDARGPDADHRPAPLLEIGVATTSVVVLWFPFVGERGRGSGAELALAALVLLAATTRWRAPVPAAVVCVGATGTAAALGMTYDPMVVAAWTLYPAALRHGRRLVHPVVLALGTGALALLAVVAQSGIEDELRYVLCSAYALAAAWALGTAVRRQRELARSRAVARAESAVVGERARIAREMHDVLSHTLGTVGVRAGVAAHLTSLDETQLRGTLSEIEERSRDALAQLRLLLAATVEPGEADVTPPPGLRSLTRLVADVRGAGTPCTLTTDIRSELDPTVELAVFRIVQESLTNVVRHAPGACAQVSVVEDAHGLVHVEVTDDGPGRAPGAPAGRGLRGIEERARALAGTAAAGNHDDGGFRVRATVPAHATSAQVTP